MKPCAKFARNHFMLLMVACIKYGSMPVDKNTTYEKDLAEADSKSASDKSSDKKTDEHSEQEKSRKRKLELDSKQKDAEALILEANDRLQKAMTSKNMTEIMAAQALLQQGSKSLAEARQEIEKTSDAKKTKDK